MIQYGNYYALRLRRLYSMVVIFLLLSLFGCSTTASQPALSKIVLPSGFNISLFANVPDARSLALGKKGTIFVSTREAGNLYAIVPKKDFTAADKVIKLASDLDMPNGIAFYQGDLYVAENSRILRYPNIEDHLQHPPAPTIIYDKLPTKRQHGWRYIKFGPDGWLYVAIGAPCNNCLSQNPIFASLIRMRPDGSSPQIYASGVRNSVGFDWDPNTKQLWFTDNGRDWMGDNLPPDKLNHAPHADLHFGFPYYHAKNLPDPKFSKELPKNLIITYPAIELAPHAAALGMVFYTGKMFPSKYHNQIFIAEHGSWNRSQKIGYRITWVTLENSKAISYQPFATGWLQGQSNWGRPVDLLVLPDGSMLVSDDDAGAVYRISYHKNR